MNNHSAIILTVSRIFSYILLTLNVLYVSSFINELYKLHISFLDLGAMFGISNLFVLILISFPNFALNILTSSLVLNFVARSDSETDSIRFISWSNIALSFMLIITAIVPMNHISDVKLFPDVFALNV